MGLPPRPSRRRAERLTISGRAPPSYWTSRAVTRLVELKYSPGKLSLAEFEPEELDESRRSGFPLAKE